MRNFYFREWEFFRDHLANIFVWLVFFAVLMSGLIYYSLLNEPESLTKILGSIKDALKEKGLLGIVGKNSFWVAYKIFLNNLQATLLFTALGLVPFFVGGVVFVSSVAVLLGATIALTVSKGFEIATFIKLTAPHGVVELLAVFYGASLGVFLSKQITKKLFPKHRESTVPWGFILKKFSASYALFILPLLALAALIESFVTPLFV
ncbi:MAG: spoIIM 3 [Deltaproteobacteria bacterium]|jgi:stage II sporulation protein M|nr:spoIIM 3 [Deltaproteobacteria bacterium]